MKTRFPTFCAVVLSLAAFFVSPFVHAANTSLWWDTNGNASGVGGTGTWDTSTADWSTVVAGTNTQVYTNTAPSTITATFDGTAGTVTLAANTTINVNTISLAVNGYTINGAANSVIALSAGAGASNSTPNIGVTTGTATINAVLSGTGLVKGGLGALILGGANTYTGNTTINGGSLSISTIGTTGSASSSLGALLTGTSIINFGNSGNAGTLIYTGAGETTTRIVNLAGGNATIQNDGSGGLNFTSNLTATVSGARSFTLQGSNGGTFGGNIVNGSATISVIKAGAGTWTLSGSNTYSGGTTIKQGNLSVTNTVGSATGGAGVAVTANTGVVATLSGNGILSGLVTTSATSASVGVAHIAPGVNISGANTNFGTAGVLQLGGGLTIGDGTNLDFDLGSGSTDRINITGGLSLGNNVVLNVNNLGGLTTGVSYSLINYTGSLVGGFTGWTATGAPAGTTSTTFNTFLVGGTNQITVTFNASATSTTYTLTATAGSANILTGGTTGITSTITNTGTGSADTLNYTGLTASSGAGGSIAGSSTSGTGVANNGGTASNTGLVFTGTSSGAVSINPILSGSATNATAGGNATFSGSTPVTVNVFDAASLSMTQSGTSTVTLAAQNAGGAFRASAKVTADNGLSNNQGFVNTTVSNGTMINSGSSVNVATFNKTGKLNGVYSATKTLQYDNVTSSGSAISGGSGNTANLGLTVTVSGQTAGAGVTFSAPLFSGQKYGTTTPGGSGTGYGLTSNIPADPHSPTTATLIGGTASASTTVNMTFYDTAAGAGDAADSAFRSSDILKLSGIVPTGNTGPDGSTLTDTFVLQLTYDASAAGAQYIGWFDAANGQWVNAIAGNSNGAGQYFGTGEFVGSYGSYLSTLSPTDQANLAFQLGAFGYNSTTHEAWAVLDHNSDFAVIPEPGTWGMILSGFGMLIGFQRLRKRRVGF